MSHNEINEAIARHRSALSIIAEADRGETSQVKRDAYRVGYEVVAGQLNSLMGQRARLVRVAV